MEIANDTFICRSKLSHTVEEEFLSHARALLQEEHPDLQLGDLLVRLPTLPSHQNIASRLTRLAKAWAGRAGANYAIVSWTHLCYAVQTNFKITIGGLAIAKQTPNWKGSHITLPRVAGIQAILRLDDGNINGTRLKQLVPMMSF